MLLRLMTGCLVLSTALVAIARADISVHIGDLSLAPGSSGLLPVTITGTTGQLLNSASFEFRITTSGPTGLEFVSSPSPSTDPTFNPVPTFSPLHYVFEGNSGDQLSLFPGYPSPLGQASLTSVPNDTFIGSDFTNNSSDVDLSTGTYLLAFLPVTTNPTASIGDSFTVSLIGGPLTSFFDSTSGSFLPDSNPGTVTIAIVPEPSARILGLASLMALMIILWHRRRALTSSRFQEVG